MEGSGSSEAGRKTLLFLKKKKQKDFCAYGAEPGDTAGRSAQAPGKRRGAISFRTLILVFHRYAGLAVALFLILEGLTGSVLAFYTPLERLIEPHLYAPPHPGRAKLSPAEIAARAETLAPTARVGFLTIGEDQASVSMLPRDAAHPPGFDHLLIDPYTGKELGRRRDGDITEGAINLLPFIYRLHRDLALGPNGALALGVVALLWTIDTISSTLLTPPRSRRHFLRRFGAAWKIKQTKNTFRLNYDIHRAASLWLWPVLLIFAWSSVMLDLPTVYDAVMNRVADRVGLDGYVTFHPVHNEPSPKLSWQAANLRARVLMADIARQHHLRLGEELGIGYQAELGVYDYAVRSSADIRWDDWNTGLWLDGDTGALQSISLPTGERTGDAIDNLLWALHYADLRGMLIYRIFVCAFGVVLSAIAATGVYIWWRKRNARTSRHGDQFLQGEVT